KIIDVLKRLSEADLQIRIIAGAANPHLTSLRDAAIGSGGRIEVLSAVSDVSDSMAWADLAISAGGTTSWEIAFMGLPAGVGGVADHQGRVAGAPEEEGAALNIGRWTVEQEETLLRALGDLIGDAKRRRSMGGIGRALVDGAGARRVAERLREPTTDSKNYEGRIWL